MNVQLKPDQEAFVRQAIEAGRFQKPEQAVDEALALWEARERSRAEFLATLLDARAAIERGEGLPITEESVQDLAADVKRRGEARLLARQVSPSP